MKKNILGKTGLEVTQLGFGGIPIQRLTEKEAIELIKEAKKQGINFIDTAIAYTVSEQYIGKALKEVGRDSFYIATKAMGYDYETMKKYIDQSLKQLDVDYIDLYQIHNCSKPEQFEKVMSENSAFKALKEAKEAGKIRHIGVTSHSKEYIEKFLDMDIVETVQFPFNVVEQQAVETFKKAKERNIGVIAMKPMAGGAIRDGELALKYIFNSGLVSVAIPGVDSIEQVRQNCNTAINCGELTQADINKIEEVRKELGNNFCRRCGYCLPCPMGIDIPSMFVYEGYVTRYNMKEWGTERYEGLAVKADACVKCGACEKMCPYNLPIREKLEGVVKVFQNK